MKTWNERINMIMSGSISLTIIRFIIDYVDLNYLRPEVYAMHSAPWYVGGLVYGAITLVVLLICVIIKVIIKNKSDKGA